MAKKEIQEEVAVVSVSLGATINMGDYESLKVSVGLSYPCKANKTQVSKTTKEVYTLVKKEMAREIKELTGQGRSIFETKNSPSKKKQLILP
jgi:hypothetical protein